MTPTISYKLLKPHNITLIKRTENKAKRPPSGSRDTALKPGNPAVYEARWGEYFISPLTGSVAVWLFKL